MSAVMKKSGVDDRRRQELAKIHIARARLRLSDELYREIIGRVAPGKRSSAELDQVERGRLLDEFQKCGFVEGASHTTKLDDFDDAEPQHRLIRGLWSDCAKLGIVRNGSDKALRHFIKRVGGADSIRWLNAQASNRVIEALKAMKTRAGHRQRSPGRQK
jgi:phage gp16-like protein